MPVDKFGGGRGRKLVRTLLAGTEGWTVATTNGNHIRLTGPAGELVFIAATPSDFRALQNNRALLRRITRQTQTRS
jgi:hypothetical protein